MGKSEDARQILLRGTRKASGGTSEESLSCLASNVIGAGGGWVGGSAKWGGGGCKWWWSWW